MRKYPVGVLRERERFSLLYSTLLEGARARAALWIQQQKCLYLVCIFISIFTVETSVPQKRVYWYSFLMVSFYFQFFLELSDTVRFFSQFFIPYGTDSFIFSTLRGDFSGRSTTFAAERRSGVHLSISNRPLWPQQGDPVFISLSQIGLFGRSTALSRSLKDTWTKKAYTSRELARSS